MEILFILLPLSIILVVVVLGVFFWAVNHDQFSDLEGPAHRVLMDDDSPGSVVDSKSMRDNSSSFSDQGNQ